MTQIVYLDTGSDMLRPLTLRGDRVVETPRTLGYMKGWELHKLRTFANKRGWRLARVTAMVGGENETTS